MVVVPSALWVRGGDFEFGGQGVFGDDQGMVAGAGHGAGDSGEDGLAVVRDAAGFAVHELRGADDVASEGCADGLVAEADSEDGPLAGEALNERDENAGVLRRAGAGREHEPLGREGFDLVDRELIVAADDHFGAEFAHVLHQVVGEGVVVVENKDHGKDHREEST